MDHLESSKRKQLFREDFIAVSPKSEALQKLIPYYYFYQTFDKEFSKEFNYFPHYRTGLTIHQGSQVSWDSKIRIVTPKKGEYSVFLTKNLKTKRIAKDFGIINKICIAFEPLGINHFLKEDLNSIAPTDLSYFNHFGSEFQSICNAVFSTSVTEERTDLLDKFFLKRLHQFSEPVLEIAVKEILESSKDISIQALSNSLDVNRKMLTRIFQKHLGCSPKTFEQLVKFRKAFNQYQEADSFSSLAAIAYDNHYYDQSDFINSFKKLTGSPPKSLFSTVNQIAFDIYWSENSPRMSQKTN